MRKVLLLTGIILALGATAAAADGVQIAWSQCFGQAGATANRTSTCASNTGSNPMYTSFVTNSTTQLEGCEVYVDFQEAGGALQCWWNFTTPRPTKTASALTVLPLAPNDLAGTGNMLISCGNTLSGNPPDLGFYFTLGSGAAGGGGMVITGPDRGQLKGIVAVQAGTGTAAANGHQEYAVGFSITNAGTLPAGTCNGCSDAVCLVLNRILLTQGGGFPDVELTNPNDTGSNFVTWQGGGGNCPGATPTKKATWGSIKALYR